MAGWQAGLLVLVQSVLQHMHVVLPANTAANNLQTGYQLVQMHRSWQAECMAGWQAGLLVLVQKCCSICMWCCLQTQLQTICKQVQPRAWLLCVSMPELQ